MKQWVDRLYARMDALGERLGEKQLRIPVDLTAGIVFFLFAVVILLMVVMMLCCAMLVGKELYKLATKRPMNWKVIHLQTELKALVILAILVVSYLLARVTDLFVVGSLVCSLGFLVYFRCRKPSYYAITLTLAVAIWAAFRFVLNVDF